jgi:ankyrin repeat protein
VMWAAMNGKSEAVNMLLEQGASATDADANNRSAVDYAQDFVDVLAVISRQEANNMGRWERVGPSHAPSLKPDGWHNGCGGRPAACEGRHGCDAHPVPTRVRSGATEAGDGGALGGRLPQPPGHLQVGLRRHRCVPPRARAPRAG